MDVDGWTRYGLVFAIAAWIMELTASRSIPKSSSMGSKPSLQSLGSRCQPARTKTCRAVISRSNVPQDNGTFLMYFSGSSVKGNGSHCVGAAYSDVPEGPYTALDKPLACNFAMGGSIDSSSFVDWETKGEGWGYNGHTNSVDQNEQCWTEPKWWGGGSGGRRYMLYKIDGNTRGHGGPCGNTVRTFSGSRTMVANSARSHQSSQHRSFSRK